MQLLAWNAWCLIVAGQQVSPDVLLLQASKEVLDLQYSGQTSPLFLHLSYLLLLHGFPLGLNQLQGKIKGVFKFYSKL